MLIRKDLRLLLILTFIAATFDLMIAGFSFSQPTQSTTRVPSGQETPADTWKAFQERSPFPYKSPLPPSTSTSIDGIYIKQEPFVGEHVPCRRCPDWLYEGGLWKIRFDRGIYRVFYAELGWRSLGSYTVSEDRLFLFNDPHCIDDIGVYKWKLEKGILTFQVIDDLCAIKLRGKNLTHLPWISCQPPNAEAAVTNHWKRPKGCE